MTQASSRIFDDFARLITDAAGLADGARREVETAARVQAERILRSLDVVSREEFDAVREIAIAAREENEKLAARVETLEARLEARLAEAENLRHSAASGDGATPSP